MSEQRSTVEGWAILEMMGHQRMAGYVRETTIAGAGMLAVQVPADGENLQPCFTRYVSPSSLYALTPCTEETARRCAAAFRPKPVNEWELPQRPALPAGAPSQAAPDDDGEDDEDRSW